MNTLNAAAAEVLETSAAGYAAAALAELSPALKTPPVGGDSPTWKMHLMQRVLELAAAVRVAEPVLFARRVQWLRRAARARGVGDRDLKQALLSLQAALERELPENLKHTVAPALALAVETFDDATAEQPYALDPEKPLDRLALRYLALCLEGQPHDAIAAVLRALDDGLPPENVYVQVLLAAEREIGELWHSGDISIAEEHLVTETTRELMTRIVSRRAPTDPVGPSLIAASVTGNTHDIGLRAVTDLFRLAGWRCLYLGANLPASEIARAAETFDVELVVLNTTLATQLKALGEAIATIRHLAPMRKILVGGLAFEGLPDLWRQLGADAYAPTIDGAVGIGAALVRRN